MNLDTRFYKGGKDMPLAVFIHGMGMNVNAWSDPEEARILGGKYPLTVLVDEKHAEMRTSFHDLREAGFTVLSWSQSRPVGPVGAAVSELQELMREYEEFAGRGIMLICHSRGGLIARKYLEDDGRNVIGLITLATPHHGTSMARWAALLSPVTSALNQILNGFSKKELDSAARRVLGFLSSRGLRELLPGSGFFSDLKDVKRKGVKYLSVGGTNPDLLRAVSVSLPDLISRLVPGNFLPQEMRVGYGDGLVSAASAVLPYTEDHRDFHLNHASILFSGEVRKYILEAIRTM
jgi:pimeloyl-ACP methyl ester carboxylesterase